MLTVILSYRKVNPVWIFEEVMMTFKRLPAWFTGFILRTWVTYGKKIVFNVLQIRKKMHLFQTFSMFWAVPPFDLDIYNIVINKGIFWETQEKGMLNICFIGSSPLRKFTMKESYASDYFWTSKDNSNIRSTLLSNRWL